VKLLRKTPKISQCVHIWRSTAAYPADAGFDATEHTAEGTRTNARVPIPLAASLHEFAAF
jgi:hypothetical protein